VVGWCSYPRAEKRREREMERSLMKTVMILVMAAVVGLPNVVVVVKDGSRMDGRERGTIGYMDDGDVAEGERGNDWRIETVDYAGMMGNTNIAVDSFNLPHLIYFENYDAGLKYAHHDGKEWHYDYVNPNTDTEFNAHMSLDSNNRPHISYRDYDTNKLKYVHYDGIQWNEEIVDYHAQCMRSSITIDGQDRPHICYQDFSTKDLRYAFYDGAAWHIETVDSDASVGDGSEIAIDNDGGVHICYAEYNPPNNPLKYAYFNGVQWRNETLHPNPRATTSLAVDAANRPHLSYLVDDNNVFIHTYHDGNHWKNETVENEVLLGFNTISIDAKDHVHICYSDDGEVKYAYNNGQIWELEIVDSTESSGGYTSLAVDSYCRPHIHYRHKHTSLLKYAVIPDNELPNLDADDSPSTGTTGEDFLFNVSASDNYDVASVSIEWDHGTSGENLPLTMSGAYWTGSITLEHSIEPLNYIVHITDVFGNEYISESRTVLVVDNDLPILIVDETQDTGTTGDDVMFSIRASDNIAVERVYIEWFQEETNGMISLDLSSGFWSGTITLAHRLEDFVYKLGIADAARNTYYSAERHVSVTDNDAPEFIDDGSDRKAATGEEFDLVAEFEDNIRVRTVDVFYSIDGVNYESKTMETGDEGIWNLSIVLPIYPTNMSYYFIAQDEEGNEFNSFDEFGLYFVEVMDTIKPIAKAGDDGKIDQFQEFVFDGGGSIDNDGIDNYTWSFEYNGSVQYLYGMEVRHRFDIAGNYTVTLVVKDRAENIGVNTINVSVREIDVGNDDNDDDVTSGDDDDGNETVEGQGGSGVLVWVIVVAVVAVVTVVGAIIVVVLVLKKGGKEI